MSILLDTSRSQSRISSTSSAGWFVLYFFTVMVGGALLGGWLIQKGLQVGEGFFHNLIVEHGPARILRRFQTLCAILLAPWMLKKIGWGGARDLGWSSSQSREERKRDFLRWFGFGVIAMGLIFSLGPVLWCSYLQTFLVRRFSLIHSIRFSDYRNRCGIF